MALPANTEILETLGEGSFGVVFVASIQEGTLKRTVVLKVLKKDWVGNEEVLVRARDEAALLSRLNHDNIVRVEQLTSHKGRPAVVMEYIQGMTLDRVIEAQGPMPVSVALSIVAKVCSALDAAYNGIPPGEERPLRVIHRDLKPSNIILSMTGVVKVLDFGTARGEFDDREAATRALALGSPLYMAPEAFDGTPATPAVDTYALGATLFELVAGVALGRLHLDPYKHTQQLNKRLSQLRPRDLSEGPALDALRNLIERCIRYQADKRPTARDLRRLCREYNRRLPGGGVPLDQFAEVVVEPLYRQRKILPPISLEGTLDPSGIRKLANGRRNSDDVATAAFTPSAGGSAFNLADLASEPSAQGGTPAPGPASPSRQETPAPRLASGPSGYGGDAALRTNPGLHTNPGPHTNHDSLHDAESGLHPNAEPPEDDWTDEEISPVHVGMIALFAFVCILIGALVVFAVMKGQGGSLMDLGRGSPEIVTEPRTPAAPAPVAPAPPVEPTREPAPDEAKTPAGDGISADPPRTEAAPPSEPADTKPSAAEPSAAEPSAAVTSSKAKRPAASSAGKLVEVKLVSIPAGADIEIQGRSVHTPGAAQLTPGSANARVTFPDGASTTCAVTVAEGRLAFRQSSDGTIRCP